MRSKGWKLPIATLAVMITGFGVVKLAPAQNPNDPNDPSQQGDPGSAVPPGPFPSGGMGPGPMMGPGMMGMMGNSAAMTALGSSVYILRGNTLLKLNATTLAIEARTELPAAGAGAMTRGRANGGGLRRPAPGGLNDGVQSLPPQ